MKESKRIKVQQSVIEKQNKLIEHLKEENDELKVQLEIEKLKVDDSYEKTKCLMDECQKAKQSYEQLIHETEEIKRQCDSELERIKQLKADYGKNRKSVIWKIKKIIR